MRSNKQEPFRIRAFVALAAAFSGLSLPLTGVANHLLQLEPMTIERHAWMAGHTALGVAFVLFSVWHVILNRRTLWSHVRGLAARVSREAVYAAALIALVLAVAVGHAFHAG